MPLWLTKLAALALRYWWVFVIVGLALALAVTKGELKKTDARLAEARAALVDPVTRRSFAVLAGERQRDLDQCRTNSAALDRSLTAQNAAVADWKGRAAQLQQRAAEASRRAQTAARDAERRAGAILAAEPGADVCQSADALILGSLK